MELTLTTPAMLFPAISLLLLAYTNRFLALAGVIRTLHDSCIAAGDRCDISLKNQITNLRKRVHIIRDMQGFGTASFFMCVLSMLLIYFQFELAAGIAFGLSLILLLISLLLSLWEIHISVVAIETHLSDMDIQV